MPIQRYPRVPSRGRSDIRSVAKTGVGVVVAGVAATEEAEESVRVRLLKRWRTVREETSPRGCPSDRNCRPVALRPLSSPTDYVMGDVNGDAAERGGRVLFTMVSIVLALSVLVLMVVSEAVLEPMTTTFGTVRQLRLPPADLKCNLRSAEAA